MTPRTAPQAPPTITPVSEPTYLKRIAHRALLLVLEGVGLSSLAVTSLNPDDPAQAFYVPGSDPQVLFAIQFDGRWWDEALATVTLTPGDAPTSAQVTIPRISALVRSSHRKDFRLERQPGTEGQPDADVQVALSDILEMHGALLSTAPLRPPDPALRRRRAVIRALRRA